MEKIITQDTIRGTTLHDTKTYNTKLHTHINI